MPSDLETLQRLRKLLDALIKAERSSKDDMEVVHDRVIAEISQLPRDGILEALDRAVGKNIRRRKFSILILAQLSDHDAAVERFVEMLRNPDEECRQRIVETIGANKLIRFAEALNPLILNDPHPFVRISAIHAARNMKSEVNLPAILSLASGDEEAIITRLITSALKDYATESCRPFLEARFRDRSNHKEDRVVAAWGLAKLGDQRAIEFLVEMLDDPDTETESGFFAGVSLRAAQALCDVHAWPFQWHRESVEATKKRWLSHSN